MWVIKKILETDSKLLIALNIENKSVIPNIYIFWPKYHIIVKDWKANVTWYKSRRKKSIFRFWPCDQALSLCILQKKLSGPHALIYHPIFSFFNSFQFSFHSFFFCFTKICEARISKPVSCRSTEHI